MARLSEGDPVFPKVADFLAWRPANPFPYYVLALVPFCIAFAFWWIHPAITIDADSERYLTGSPMRTATYPLFLRVANGPALLEIQLFLLAASLSWLAVYTRRFLPWIACAALVLAVGSNPYVWQLQSSIMSEALTVPLLSLLAGCILGFSVTKRPALIVAAALVAGIATTVRPPLFPLILTPLVALWIAPKLPARLMYSLVILTIFATPVAAERLYSRAVHGSKLTSPLGRTLFMKAAVLDAPPTAAVSDDPVDNKLAQLLNHGFEPARQTIHKARDRDVRYILLSNYEACAWLACVSDIIDGSHMSEAELHPHLLRVAIARLMSNPLGYLELVATEYHRIWLLHPRKVPAIAAKYNAFLAENSPLPFQAQMGIEGQPTPLAEQKQIFRVNRAAFAALGLLAALMTIALVFWRRGSLHQAALALLVGSEAVLLFCAFVGVGFPRYAMGIWPILISGVLFGMIGSFAWFAANDPTPSRAPRAELRMASGSRLSGS
jgi:predicted membrane protein